MHLGHFISEVLLLTVLLEQYIYRIVLTFYAVKLMKIPINLVWTHHG